MEIHPAGDAWNRCLDMSIAAIDFAVTVREAARSLP